MKRREFLKNTGYGLAGAALTVPVLSSAEDRTELIVSNGEYIDTMAIWDRKLTEAEIEELYNVIECPFEIYENGLIKYVGRDDKTYTVQEFHEFLKNDIDAMMATDEVLQLNSPWYIDEYTAKVLTDGAISCERPDGVLCLWTSWNSIGDITL